MGSENLQVVNRQADVLVIGAGGAGLLAARAAAAAGADVLLVAKGVPGLGTATYVAGGVAASGPEPDSPEVHYLDTMKAGVELNDPRLVRCMVERVNGCLDELEALGARFDRDEDGNRKRRWRGGHSHPRHVIARGDRGGQEVVRALLGSLGPSRVQVVGDLFVSDLALSDGEVVGAFGLDLRRGEIVSLRAGASIMAAGGAGRLYAVNHNPASATGDGYALAARAGAELRDMEMVAFHPGVFYAPGKLRGLSCREPAHFAAMGAKLVNGLGEPFAARYDPRGEFATRDIVVQAEYAEIRAGRGSPNGGVYLDLSGLSREARLGLRTESRKLYNQCKVIGLDIAEKDDRIELGPGMYYMGGGVVVDLEGRSTVPGLFACGEVVGGFHGANRLSGNAMAELLAVSEGVGAAAARYATVARRAPVPAEQASRERGRIASLLKPGRLHSPELESELQDIMWRRVGVIRNGVDLEEARTKLHNLRALVAELAVPGAPAPYNMGLLHALEVANMVELGEMVAASALHRRESRGAHYREDYPETDDARWKVGVFCRREDGELKLWTEPIQRPWPGGDGG